MITEPDTRTKNIKLFCFPYAGASFYSYNPLANELPAEFDVMPLDLPGHGRRIKEQLLDHFHDMVDDLLPYILKESHGRYAFFGHSLGALLAYETACRIHKTGKPMPCHLFLSGRRAPSIPSPEISVRGLSREAFLKKVADYGGTPAVLLQQEDFMDFMEPILRADFEAVAGYRQGENPTLSVPVTVMLGTREQVSAAEAEKWQTVTTAPTTVRWFEGGHFFLFDHPADIGRLMRRQVHEKETAAERPDRQNLADE